MNLNDLTIRLLEDLKLRDSEITILKEKVTGLEGEVRRMEAVIYEDDTIKYNDIVLNLEVQHKQELERVHSEHEAQIKEFLDTHKDEIERLKAECAGDLVKLRHEHKQEVQSIREAHQLELSEAQKTDATSLGNSVRSERRERRTDNSELLLIKSLENDLNDMETERRNLKGMQSLMKGLITDLALHYSLSEKQVGFLNNTSLLDSYLEGRPSSSDLEESMNPMQTPWKYFPSHQPQPHEESSGDFSRLREGSVPPTDIANESILSMEEISDLIRNGTFLSELENSAEVLKELQRQVKQSNQKLQTMEPGSILSKLSGLLTPPESAGGDSGASSGDSGGDAVAATRQLGKWEVEKVRLELELAAAKQRLQELEIGGGARLSFSKDEVMSGIGGDTSAEESEGRLSDVQSFREVRDKSAKFLSNNVEGREASDNSGAADLLSQLLFSSDQMNNKAKVQIEDLTQQLDVADKQLRSTRQFLEEQATERELEREEWEKKLALAKSAHGQPKLRYTAEYSEQEESNHEEETQQKQGEDKGDYDALVEKVFQLREIIRGLESEGEEKTKTVDRKVAEVDELRSALMESLLKQEVVQKELDNLRNSSTDKEMIDLIEGLKEQLNTKSQELVAHRAAQQHLTDVKAHIRGLQERVEQSTRELETSVLGQDGSSPSSSRSSSPLNVMKSGVSFEDVGAVEIEEVARLEKKLVHQEKVEASAVKKIQALEAEIIALKAQVDKLTPEMENLNSELEAGREKLARLESDCTEERKLNAKLETELMTLKGFNVEDLQAENSVLQDRVVSLQFQVSTLQAEKQASKHRKPSQSSEMEFIIKERAELNEVLEKTKDKARSLELERDSLQDKCNNMLHRIKELESDLDSVYDQSHDRSTLEGGAMHGAMQRMKRDKAELEEINGKLLKELGDARAAVLAAQKIKISKIADDLIREKNAEIDSLKQQLNEMSKELSKNLDNTAANTPGTWTSGLTARSVEQLRDGPIRSLPFIPEISLNRNDYMYNKLPSPLTENFEEVMENSLNLKSPKRHISSKTLTPKSFSGLGGMSSPRSPSKSSGVSVGTQSQIIEVSQPVLEFTQQEESEDKPDNKSFATTQNHTSAEFDELKSQLEEKEKKIEGLREEMKVLEQDLESKTNDISVREKQTQDLTKNYEDLKDQYAKSNENIGNLESQIVELEEKVVNSNKIIEELKQSMNEKESMIARMNSQLTAKQERIESLESKSLEGAEPNLADEVRQLREELEDRIRGMENLHSVMEMTEHELDTAKSSEAQLREKCKAAEDEVAAMAESNKQSSQKMGEMESAVDAMRRECDAVTKEKETAEGELVRVKREMASVDAVVKEMTVQFKQESQARLKEVESLQSLLKAQEDGENILRMKYSELETEHHRLKERYDNMQSKAQVKYPSGDTKNIGSLSRNVSLDESISNLTHGLNQELDIRSELDESLLHQLISANTTLTSTDEPSEMQRLLQKIQQDGVRVLSLSERLFLTNQVQDENMKRSLENRSLQEATRKLELMRFDIEQERIINKDLQSALDLEKQNSLDLLSKLSDERKLRNKLEDELNSLQRQVRSLETRLRNASYAVDADNAEHIITIDAQKEQIESLEESLKIERENFNQLQNVLSVERKRNSNQHHLQQQQQHAHQGRDVAQERRDEDDINELRNQLRTERQYREQLETNLGSGKSGEVAKLIISRLHAELDAEHRKVRDLSARLNQEKKKYTSLYHDVKYQNTESQQSSEVGSVDNFEDSWNRVWRTRELELERLVADLNLKVEILETSNGENSETIANLQIQLQEEREKDNSGISSEQLERMKQVNAFLEHSLKENGEMLATISRLQEERHDLRSKLYHAKLSQPVPGGLEFHNQPARAAGDYHSKFLRSESYRKALIWQKKYLLVQISGGYFVSEPVMKVSPPKLHGCAKFRAAVHVIVSIHRMKFLVKRWRSGKRSTAVPTRPPRDRTLSLQHGSLDTRSMSSMSKKQHNQRPDTLSLALSSMETQSLISSPIVHQPRSHGSGLRRASSLRERPSMARSVDSPGGSVSSTSSALFRPPPVVTGRTPPTRDMDTRVPRPMVFPRSSGSTPRRNLDAWLLPTSTALLPGDEDEVRGGGLDADLVADIREYQEQYSRLEKQLGMKL